MTLLFFSMVFLNLTIGILGLRYLRNIDDDYSKALDNAINSQDNLRMISLQATRTLAETMLFPDKNARSGDALAILHKTGEVSDKVYSSMENGPFATSGMKDDLLRIKNLRAKWRESLSTYLELLQKNENEKAANILKDQVYPNLTMYLTQLDIYSSANKVAYTRLNDQLTNQTISKQYFLFGLSVLPLATLVAIPVAVLIFAILVVVVLILKPAAKKKVSPSDDEMDYEW